LFARAINEGDFGRLSQDWHNERLWLRQLTELLPEE
jgi:hypothetical protein